MLKEKSVYPKLISIFIPFVVLVVDLACTQTVYECPHDWASYKDSCYRFEASNPETYDGAWLKCHVYGAGLVHIQDIAESSFVVNWLQLNDPLSREWYTSGVIYPDGGSGPVHFAWQSTGRLVDSTLWSLWLTTPIRGQSGVIVYSLGDTGYGWLLGDARIKRQYICKIDKKEAYRIHAKRRGSDYGFDINDEARFEKGPKFLVQPKSTMVVAVKDRSSLPVVLECVVESTPPSVYRWYKENNQNTPLLSSMDSRYTITNGRLEIKDPDESKDSGLYHCVAENKFGKVVGETVEVAFGYLKEFNNVGDAPTVARAYDGARIECSQIAFKPAVSYQWTRGEYGQFVRTQFQTYMFISGNGKLYFSEVTSVDETTYTCIVTLEGLNQFQIGTSQPPIRNSLPIQLTVLDQPAKAPWGPVIQDEFIQVFPSPPLMGYNIRMECFAYGSQNTPFKYSWSRDDGKPLPETSRLYDQNRILFIRNAMEQDAGVYRCTVSRGSASDSKTLDLQLSAKPYFVSPLRDQYADIGSQLTWICGARGPPNPVYTWYKDGKPLFTNRNMRFVVQTNVLTILDLEKDLHDGMYQCKALNSLGNSLSTAQLKVLSFPPNFDKHPNTPELYSPETGDVSLPCQPEGAPHPDVTWDKDGQVITQGTDKYKLLGDGHLRILNLSPSDEGIYTCTASNIFGEAKVSTGLKVTGGASITVMMSDNEVVVNETILLKCEASFPDGMDTVYEWKFNNHLIDFRDTHYGTVNEPGKGHVGLYIISTQREHEGRYTCTARTPFNAAPTSGYLTVIGPPREPSGVSVDATSMTTSSALLKWTSSLGQNVIFHVIQMANGFEPEDWNDILNIPVAESIKTEEEVKNPHHSALIEGLHPGTSYHFRVIGINSYGRGTPSLPSSYARTLNAAPAVAPQDLRGGGGSTGVLTMLWNPLHPSEYGGERISYRVYWKTQSPTHKAESLWQFRDINDPEGFMLAVYVNMKNYYLPYDAKIQAKNNIGPGPNSSVVTVFSAEGLPLKTPENVQMSTYNSTAIEVTWVPVEDNRLNVRGKLLGYQINYWNLEDKPEEYFQNIRYYGQHSGGLVIGLEENVDMVMDVQIFNSVGLGPRSNKFVMETSGYAPLTYPQEVHISSAGMNNVHVWWRGISLTVDEEALSGFAIWVWVATEDFASARLIDVEEIVFEYTVKDIEEGFVYALRMAAVGGGGYGRKTPTMYFTMEGQILIDSNFASTIDIYLSPAAQVTPHFLMNTITIFISLLLCLCPFFL